MASQKGRVINSCVRIIGIVLARSIARLVYSVIHARTLKLCLQVDWVELIE